MVSSPAAVQAWVGKIIEIKDKVFEYPQRKHLPLRKPDLGILDRSSRGVRSQQLTNIAI
jgi:hypothetical protein